MNLSKAKSGKATICDRTHQFILGFLYFHQALDPTPLDMVEDIEDYLRDAASGKRKIFYSTIALVEIRRSFLKGTTYGTVSDFFADMERAFFPIDPNPNIMIAAGNIRDCPPTSPSDSKTPNQRVIGTADAIHLATCLHVRDTLGVDDIIFHTFDDGKGKTWEGKCVPLLSLERWYPQATRRPEIVNVCSLKRTIPTYPQARMQIVGGTDVS